ncbi:MAG: histidine kinase, partial [Gemmatimonadota bacterium]
MRLLPRNSTEGWTPYAWLVYLGAVFLTPALSHAGVTVWVLTVASVAVFLVFYFRVYWVSGNRILWYVAGIAGLGAALAPINHGAATYFIYASAFLGHLPSARLAVRCMLILLVIIALESWGLSLPPQFWTVSLVFTVMVGAINIHYGQVGQANARLRLAQGEVEHLAQVAERERIARDLHDVLGHTLSLIILKSELAARLADRDPARAAKEIREVEAISRQALSEVRRAITGDRAGSLASEMARVAVTLESAGVAVEATAPPIRLTPTQESILALAVREAGTNIIRHANASRCDIRLTEIGGQCRLE